MGMDVVGKEPKTNTGEYFRRSVWVWRPLATFITSCAPQEITGNCQSWQYNEGDGLDAIDSERLATALQALLNSGFAKTYITERDKVLAALPDEQCEWCHGTGVRRDAIAVENKQHVRVIEEEGHPRKGQVGWCNACNGIGHKPPIETYYRLEEQDIKDFIDFLRHCGGFQIY